MGRLEKIVGVVPAAGLISSEGLSEGNQTEREHVEVEVKEIALDDIITLTAIIQEFQEVQERFADVNDENTSLFKTSINRTITCLRAHRYISSMYINIPGFYRLLGIDMESFFSPDYWQNLRQGLHNYGFHEVGDYREGMFFQIGAKQYFLDRFPSDDVWLITKGVYRGFYVRGNGDLVVPGVGFYKGVLEGKIDPRKAQTTESYYKTQISLGEYWIESGRYEKAIEVLGNVLRNLKLPEMAKAIVHNNMGIAYVQISDPSNAVKSFNNATKIDANLQQPYLERGKLFEVRGQYDLALYEFTKALELEKKKNYRETSAGTILVIRNNDQTEILEKRIESIKQRMQ